MIKPKLTIIQLLTIIHNASKRFNEQICDTPVNMVYFRECFTVSLVKTTHKWGD